MAAVSIFGLGYVGCVSAACFSEQGHEVIGVDVNPTKVELINAGRSPVVEDGLEELLARGVASGRLRATVDAAAAVEGSSLSMICVGTPSRSNGGQDLSFVLRVAEQIGSALKAKGSRHTVVLRSTVPPGTTESLLRPVLEAASGKRAGRDFELCMNPEFLREGCALADFHRPPYTLIGATDPAAAAAVQALYSELDAAVHITPPAVAEMIKFACNGFHGLKVTFANEIGNVCKRLGIDSHEVMRLVCEDRKLNLSPAYLKPGFAFGGSCLPKDLRALIHQARQHDLDVPLLEAILESNRRQVQRAVELVLASGQRKVGVLGLSFKEGTDDLRESPMVALVEALIGKGLQLSIYDGNASPARVMGANREYVEREIPHIWSLMRQSVDEVLAASELVVVGTPSREFEGLGARLRAGQQVIDLVRVFGPRRSNEGAYQGLCW